MDAESAVALASELETEIGVKVDQVKSSPGCLHATVYNNVCLVALENRLFSHNASIIIGICQMAQHYARY